MSDDLPNYDVLALRFAMRDASRRDHFIGGDPVDAPMPMDYFIYALRDGPRVTVIDTGFTREVSDRRRRQYIRTPMDALRLAGIEPADVSDVILTHLHYDHSGNLDAFPKATFHLQEEEMVYVAGAKMRHPFLSRGFEVEDIVQLVRLNFARRIRWYTGDGTVAPGIEVRLAGGHSKGLQFVRVHTKRGWVVLASDVSHYYENMESGRPFMAALDVVEMVNGFELLSKAAPSPDHIIPGHDPLVMQYYPAPSEDLQGIVARLDVAPNASRSQR